jgi:SAM-dependent methyltransferase
MYNITKLYEKYPLMKYRRLEYYTENKRNIEEEKRGIYDNYDELGYKSITKIINIIKEDINDEDIFYDLGSGLGKVTIQFYIETLCKKVVGIEYFKDLFDVSIKVKNSINIKKGRSIEFYQGNLMNFDVNEATIIYFGVVNDKGAKLVEDDILKGIVIEKIKKSKNIRIVISLTPLDIIYKKRIEKICVPLKINGKVFKHKNYPFPHYIYYL